MQYKEIIVKVAHNVTQFEYYRGDLVMTQQKKFNFSKDKNEVIKRRDYWYKDLMTTARHPPEELIKLK